MYQSHLRIHSEENKIRRETLTIGDTTSTEDLCELTLE